MWIAKLGMHFDFFKKVLNGFSFLLSFYCVNYVGLMCIVCLIYIFMILYDNTKQNSGNGAHWNFPWPCLTIDTISIQKNY
jgi:hypothetical protein